MTLKEKSFQSPGLLTKWVNDQGDAIKVVSVTHDTNGHHCFYYSKPEKKALKMPDFLKKMKG